jgi:transcriptional regulator with XRE-family HTH domain
MGGNYNTVSVIGVNTRSAIGFGQTAYMARSGEISEFWRRFMTARRARDPSASARQEDIAKEYGVYQSSVTKWKTGKSLPKPKKMREIAAKEGCTFEWLNSGDGDMRPAKATDPITRQVIEAMEALSPDAKVEVLKAAIMQQTLQLPALAAQIEQANKTAEKLAKSAKLAG